MMATMDFRHELAYDASPAEVFEMLADPAFREAVDAAMDVVSADVTLERTGDGFTLTNDMVQKTAGLPAFATKLFGETTRALQHEEWSSPAGGTLRIETPGKPTSASGTIRLEPRGAGTTEVVELEIKAKIPVVGGKIAGVFADQVREGMDVEHGVGRAWLRGER